MNLKINSVHFKTDKGLDLFIKNKIDKLSGFYEGILNGNVTLKLGNDPINNKVVEIKLNCEGCSFYAKKEAKSFERSTEMVVEALRRQIRKKRTKSSPKK